MAEAGTSVAGVADDRPSVADVEASIALIRAVTTITTDEQNAQMSAAWLALKDKIAAVQAHFAPRKRKAHEAWKQWIDDEKQVCAPIEEAIAHASGLIAAYAAKRAVRVAEEQHRQAQALRAEQEERALQQAAVLSEVGIALGDASMVAEAEHVLERALVAEPVVPARPSARPIAGMRLEDYYDVVVTDAEQAVKTLAQHPREIGGLVTFTASGLKALGKRYGESLAEQLPGFAATKHSKPRKNGRG